MKNYLLLLISFLAFSLTSCHEEEEPVVTKEWPESNHTLLIYMIGDNNLSEWCEANTEACIKGLLHTETPINLVIYEDGNSTMMGEGKKGTPALFRLKRNYENKEKIDTIMIRTFSADQNSADPIVLQEIVNEAFEAYPATIKGLELWSHGLGWAPSPNYKSRAAGNAATRATQFIGQDGDNYMEIWKLREALEKCPHLDYISFDACNMAQAEVAYELRNVADYMLACPTEILIAGLPYDVMMEILSEIKTKEDISTEFPNLIDAFGFLSNFSGGGTISFLNLKEMDSLLQAYKNLLAVCSDRVELLSQHTYTYEDYIQEFGRGSMGSAYLFYDMKDYADFLVNYQTENNPDYDRLIDAINKVVISEYHSARFLDFSDIRCCGLGVGIPEVFRNITLNRNTLWSAYQELQWSKD